MSKLERIVIQGFKLIKTLDLTVNPLNVLIGANGAGKSNFIGVLHLLNQLIAKKLQLFVGKSGNINELFHFGRKNTPSIDITLYFTKGGYSCSLVPARDTLVFAVEKYWSQNGNDQPRETTDLGNGHKESLLPEEAKNSSIAKQIYTALQDWKMYHFQDTSESAKVKQPCNINDNLILRPDASNLASYLYLLSSQYPSHYENIVATIRLAAPFFETFQLHPSRLNNEMIRLEWKHQGTDEYFNAHSLSDGTLRLICLATLLLQPRLPAIILLDEPELGLHPYAITLLAELLRSTATKTQIIVSTQSVTLVNQLTPDDIIIVNRDKLQPTFSRLQEAQISDWLDEYGLGDLWEKNILGGRPAL